MKRTRSKEMPNQSILLNSRMSVTEGSLAQDSWRTHMWRRIARVPVAILIVMVMLMSTVEARAVRLSRKQSSSTGRPSVNRVAEISEQWAKEWSAANLDALMALYAEDAVFLTATGSRTTGRAAIRELFSKALTANSSTLHVQSKLTEQSGQLAYDSGQYEETTTTAGVKRSGRGNYLVVLRRDGRKQWRIVQHMWTDLRESGQ
jgi:uncharacterized protein (TIGR02246 family)